MNNKRIASELTRVAKNIGAGTNDVFYDVLDRKGSIVLFCELPEREHVSELISLIKKQERSILMLGNAARLTPVFRDGTLVNLKDSQIHYCLYIVGVGETIEAVEERIKRAGAVYKRMD